MSDVLETTLRELAQDIRVETPEESLVARVMTRLADEPVPRRSRTAIAVAWARGSGRWVVALLAGLLVAGLAVSPVGAAVSEWFGFHGVVVSERDPGSGEPVVPSEPDALTLRDAGELVGFALRVPSVLGEPDGVTVSADRRLVSMSWATTGGTVRLDQFDGTIEPTFWKTSRDFEIVSVLDRDGLWFPTPHEVVVLPADGAVQTIAPRLAAQTLVWPRGGVTLRLEGSLTRAAAVDIAESAG